ncbi:MAG TPA: HEPN domain-containing protein [Stellaceae bacterium]|nr:HEPN domain-containing protein [Stellaceae bacterium]
MSVERRVQAFLAIAQEELRAAAALADGAPRQAAFFVQQAAEKATRAVLVKAGKAFGTSHDLGQMAEMLPPDHPLRGRITSLHRLSRAATRYRYPSESGNVREAPLPATVRADLAEVEALIVAVAKHVAQ